MKRLLLLLAVLVVACVEMSAQYVSTASEYSNTYKRTLYGLKNNSTGKWAVSPKYLAIEFMGTYEGVQYYALMDMNRQWGFMTSKDFTKMKVPHQFDAVIRSVFTHAGVPIVEVKKGALWGCIELYTDECEYIFPLKYSSTVAGGNYSLKKSDNSWEAYRWTDVQGKFDQVKNKKAIAEEKRKQEEASQRRMEEIRREVQAREARLASFTTYAKTYVTPIINQWQQKGEFEKMSDYQARVTEENRKKMIAELTKKAEQNFIEEHKKLNPLLVMSVEAYDAENEVFSIRSEMFGSLLISVPIADGQEFKRDFNMMTKSDAEYFVQNDKLALRSLVFRHPKTNKSYKYSNSAGLNYVQYEINPALLGIEDIKIPQTSTSASSITYASSANNVKSAVKPICKILSPSNGSTYDTDEVTISYQVITGAGLSYQLKVSVNGEEVVPVHINGNSKGVGAATGKSLRIKVPRKADTPCNISMWVVDSQNTLGDPKNLRLIYTGGVAKPKLHLFAVGVSDYSTADGLSNLKYASKDAKDVVNTISSPNLYANLYSDVVTNIMTDEKATRNNVLTEMMKLVSNVGQGDVVVLFFSGHGVKEDGSGDTYYMTYDSAANAPFTGINFSDIKRRIQTLTDQKKCHVLLFVDTCHAGSMYGMKGSTVELSMKMPGLVGFYSSTSGQQSAELDNIQNGVFTSAILEALNGKAQVGEEGITIHGLESYVKNRVKALTNNRQDAIVENNLGDAVIFGAKK